ncbi:MAG TPA: hypothetical protein VEH52_05495 [Gaiellaceae bacterium]|nr:hypothetical protein [Gaiellaceae bacterium]
MTERPFERQQRLTYPPVEPTPKIARKNVILGIALFVIALLIAGGAVAASFVYLHFD